MPSLKTNGSKDCWQTPCWLFQTLHAIFRFTVDAAANAENALLPRYWDQEQDGLTQDWSQERVWCNPPYSAPALFLEKATTSHLSVLLLPGNCLTNHYTHEHPPSYVAVPRGRIAFDRPGGQNGKGAAPFGTMLFLYGAITQKQICELEQEGFQVWRR